MVYLTLSKIKWLKCRNKINMIWKTNHPKIHLYWRAHVAYIASKKIFVFAQNIYVLIVIMGHNNLKQVKDTIHGIYARERRLQSHHFSANNWIATKCVQLCILVLKALENAEMKFVNVFMFAKQIVTLRQILNYHPKFQLLILPPQVLLNLKACYRPPK